MSESLEKEREGTCLATEESRSSRAERWVQSGEEWGTRSKEGNGGERQRRNTSGEKGAGKRGRPTKAELLGKERRDSSVVSIPSSWFSRRGRARESEESEDEQQAAKRKKEGKAGKSPEQQGDSEEKKMANLEEIEKMMERQLQRHKDDMMKMIRRELKEEMKQIKSEFEKFKEEEREKMEKLKEENADLKKRVEEIEKRRDDQERRDRRLNVVMRGVEVEGGNMKDAAVGVLKKLGGLDKEIKIREVYKIGNRMNDRMNDRTNESVLLVKLNSLDDKKEIMIRRNKLTGTKIYVDDDLTKDERERQKEIRLWAKREKERGRRVKVGFGKAWMNGKEYVWSEERKCMNEKIF